MLSGFEIKEVKKYIYSVYSSRYEENEIISTIMLSSENSFYGYLNFMADGSELPNAEKKYNLFYLYYHQKQLPAIVDMLRNESPVYLVFMPGNNKECRVTTTPEPIGEGEIKR